MKVREFYKDKVILITGCTGFLGKVVLEKLLRSIPEIKKIYLLVRPKSGISALERIKKDIFQSQCFDECRKIYSNFMSMVEQKIEPIEGDIIKKEVQILINNAASIDFNLRIDKALEINYFGPLRILDLAKQCEKIECFTHVSTAYVNSEKRGFIDERIYEYPNDPEEVVRELQKIPVEQQENNADQILKPWPNSYTFTKNLTERALQKLRGNVPVLIIRPAIIIAANEEPYPGWIDAMTAAGPLTMMLCTGVMKYLVTTPYVRADLIPVDIVANTIIVATAHQSNKNSLKLLHSSSSHNNPINWVHYVAYCLQYIKTSPFDQVFSNPSYKTLSKGSDFEKRMYYENVLPASLMLKTAELLKNPELKKKAQRFQKINYRRAKVEVIFRHFTSNDWCFESNQLFKIIEKMNEDEKRIFNCNIKTVDWQSCVQRNVYGMQKYMYKMDVVAPFQEQTQIISRHSYSMFDDIYQVVNKGSKVKAINLEKVFEKVLYSNVVQSQIRNQVEQYLKQHPNVSREQGYKKHLIQAKNYLKELNTEVNPRYVQSVMYIFHKQFRKMFEQIKINDGEIKSLKNMIEKDNKSILLVPSFKSHLDFVILSYIHMMYEIDLPLIVGLKEFNNMPFISTLNKKCGGFFVDKIQLKDQLFTVVLEEYIAQIMKKNYVMEYHIERRRERSGKINKPYEFIFENIIEAYLRNQDDIQDLTIVPITINYDKVYEGQKFPYELLGEENPEETFYKTAKSVLWVTEQYGRVCVKYCKPISLKEKMQEFLSQENIKQKKLQQYPIKCAGKEQVALLRKQFSDQLSQELVYTLSDNLVIMSTSLVASILLLNRIRGINEEELSKKVMYLYDEIEVRNGSLSMNVPPSSTIIKNSLIYLMKFIDIKKDVFQPHIKVKKEFKHIMMLAYYRNNLIHQFLNEAYIACALEAFGEPINEVEGISIQRLWDQTQFIAQFLNQEFMVRNQINSYEKFEEVLQLMQRRDYINIVNEKETKVKILNQGQFAVKLLSSLICPYIESYWVTLSYLINKNDLQDSTVTLANKVQWLSETLYDENIINYYESCSLETIANAIEKYIQIGVIKAQMNINEKTKETEQICFLNSTSDNGQALQKSLFERLTFFKPVVSFKTTALQYEENVKRIMAYSLGYHAKL